MARVFGVSVSRSTVLRLLGALLDRETPAPRVVGVDEYAMRKGRVYGTVLVDVETRRPVDLLPDRDASTLAKPPLVEDALGRQMLALLVQLEATCTAADQLAEAVEEVFPQHPDAEIILSFPGLGIQLGARVLAEIGDDRTRFAYAVDAPGEDLCGRAGVVQGSLVGGLLEEALGVVACGFGVGQGGGECGWRR
jgi:hypothetical protein